MTRETLIDLALIGRRQAHRWRAMAREWPRFAPYYYANASDAYACAHRMIRMARETEEVRYARAA